jgi:hypothetical protein
MWRFLWSASRGNRLTPWRSPYLLWRVETYAGLPAKSISFTQFWKFVWNEKRALLRYLVWVDHMNG